MKWIKKDVEWGWLPSYITGCMFINFINLLLMIFLSHSFGFKISERPGAGTLQLVALPNQTGHEVILIPVIAFISMILVVIIEEVMFRLPLLVPVVLKLPDKVVIIFAVVLSVMFGLGHGGPTHLLLQGVSGLLYSLLFLKCGGFQRKFFKAFVASFSAHFLSNSFCVFIILLFDGRSI